MTRKDLPFEQRSAMLARAMILGAVEGNITAAKTIAKDLGQLQSELKPALDRFRAAPAGKERFELARLLFAPLAPLVVPAGDYGFKQWYPWCASSLEGEADERFPESFVRSFADSRGRAFTGDTVPFRFFGRGVFEWTDQNPADPAVPELLHRLVRASQLSACQDGEISKGAFDRLHRRYKGSPWAQKTPYWYE